jgi:hypothetical protein
LELRLGGKDRPDKAAGDDDNRDRFASDEIDLAHQQAKADPIPKQAADDVLKEKDDLPGHAEHPEKAGAQLIRVPEHGGKIESIAQ